MFQPGKAFLFPLAFLAGCDGSRPGEVRVRLGYFPNVTHSQALVGVVRGDFGRALGDGVRLETKVFNAGPSAIEALFAGELDLTYIGPNPALSGYVRSQGKALRIIAGATSGGAALLLRKGVEATKAAELADLRLASPQLGNTQDVALRAYLQQHGLATKENGGTVQVIPVANPDILTLMLRGEIDGAWVPAPWGARLEVEAGARVFLDERTLWPEGRFVTAHVIVRTGFLREEPGLVARFLRAHVELTLWIREHQAEAMEILNVELKRLTGKALPPAVLAASFARMEVLYDPVCESLHRCAEQAFALGFLGKERPDLAGIYDLSFLGAVLAEKGLPAVR